DLVNGFPPNATFITGSETEAAYCVYIFDRTYTTNGNKVLLHPQFLIDTENLQANCTGAAANITKELTALSKLLLQANSRYLFSSNLNRDVLAKFENNL